MTARAKTRAKPTTKVKRLSFYPESRESKIGEERRAKTKTKKLQWVPTRENPIKKAPEKLPYYKERAPKYQPAKPISQQQVPVQPKPAGNIFLTLFIIAMVILFIFTAWKLMKIDDHLNGGGEGGQGLSGCPTSCNDQLAFTIAPQCSCPPDSRYYDTIAGGYHQCRCD